MIILKQEETTLNKRLEKQESVGMEHKLSYGVNIIKVWYIHVEMNKIN